MAVCPHCAQEMGSNPSVRHLCGERYYKEVCKDRYQCTVCGNIQNNTGVCSHCGMLLFSMHDHCLKCGKCLENGHCSSCPE